MGVVLVGFHEAHGPEIETEEPFADLSLAQQNNYFQIVCSRKWNYGEVIGPS
jgi:hypothetical protein